MNIFLFLFFILTTLSHSFFLLYASRLKSTHRPLQSLWKFHYIFNGMLWLLLTLWILIIQFQTRSFTFSLIGLILCTLGFFLVFKSLKKLSMKQAMGYRFFSYEKIKWLSLGFYSFLKNPIYDGFLLIYLGMWFLTGNQTNLYLTLESFLLLNGYLAFIENKDSGNSYFPL